MKKKQKFPRGSFVKVSNTMPSYMSHFEKGFIGVVEYTYAQRYGGSDIDSYSLIVLNNKGKPINSIAWYEEDQLTLVDSDTTKGKEIIEKWRFGD